MNGKYCQLKIKNIKNATFINPYEENVNMEAYYHYMVAKLHMYCTRKTCHFNEYPLIPHINIYSEHKETQKVYFLS